MFVIRDRYVKNDELCLHLYPSVIKSSLLFSFLFSLSFSCQMEMWRGLCYVWEHVTVYLCMGWREAGGVKLCVIDKLIVLESMRGFLYNHYNSPLSTCHSGCTDVFISLCDRMWSCVYVISIMWNELYMKYILFKPNELYVWIHIQMYVCFCGCE